MLVRKVALSFLLCVIYTQAWSQTFIISKDIQLDLPDSAIILQSGNSVLFKYPDWVLSHQIIDPKTFYPNVDLTGLIQIYIRNIFEPKEGELPNWLQFIAKEQAKAFKVTNKNTSQFTLGEFEVYCVFDSVEKNGNIYLVGNDYVSHFNVLSDKQGFYQFLNVLKGSI